VQSEHRQIPPLGWGGNDAITGQFNRAALIVNMNARKFAKLDSSLTDGFATQVTDQ